MALAVGSLGYVDYGEMPRVVHARLILDHVIGHTYVILNTFWFIGCNLVVSILFGLVCLALACRKLVNTTELARDRSVIIITCGASLHSVETTDKKFLLGINSFDLQFVC